VTLSPVLAGPTGADRLPAAVAAAAVAAAGCALLAARPVLVHGSEYSTPLLVLLFAALLTVGVAWPVSAARTAAGAAGMSPLVVLGIGVGAFALARLIGGGEPPVPALGIVILLNTLAAVAEEAFFRRFLYGRLLVAGTVVAVVGSAVLFALVHLTIYGPWSLPVDLAAGLLLSWQRMASGSWHAPALTHSVANVLVVI
jgi:membrane protease YdiL (CAAX protease family)